MFTPSRSVGARAQNFGVLKKWNDGNGRFVFAYTVRRCSFAQNVADIRGGASGSSILKRRRVLCKVVAVRKQNKKKM